MKKEVFIAIRTALGLSQEDLANELGVTQTIISFIESGARPITLNIEARLKDMLLGTKSAKTRDNTKLKEYIDIVQKVAKVEHRRIPAHMVEYEELVSIGIIAVQSMIKDKTEEEMERYNSAYIGTAVRWAIRNELRNRYKWYSLKHKPDDQYDEEEAVEGMDMQKAKVREAVYETILSGSYQSFHIYLYSEYRNSNG